MPREYRFALGPHMATKYEWQEDLLAALLENDKSELGRKIDYANTIIHGRISELIRTADPYDIKRLWLEEHLALQDALRTLKYLRTLVAK